MVWIIAQGKLQLHPVLLGTRDKRGLVEVLKGLSDSDEVQIQPNATGIPLVQGKRLRTGLVKAAAAGLR